MRLQSPLRYSFSLHRHTKVLRGAGLARPSVHGLREAAERSSQPQRSDRLSAYRHEASLGAEPSV